MEDYFSRFQYSKPLIIVGSNNPREMREEVSLEFWLETDGVEGSEPVSSFLESGTVSGDSFRELGWEPGRARGYRDYVKLRESGLARGEPLYEYLPQVYGLLDRYLWRHTREALEDAGVARRTEVRKVEEDLPLHRVNYVSEYWDMMAQGVEDRGLTRVFRVQDFTDGVVVETSRSYIPVRQEKGERENLPVREK